MSSITVLGPVAINDAGAPLSPRDRVALSVLVTRRGQQVSPETIAEALWGESPPVSATKVVQGCVSRLRRRLGADAIRTGSNGYTLTVPAEEVDAGRFERLVHRARDFLSLNRPDQAAYAADEALSLWRGRPLTDLEDWEPGRGESQRLTELRLQAEEVRLAALVTAGRHDEVLPEATLRVRQEPLRERRWALLARAQYQDGRQAEALATLREAREVMAEELGLDPGQELVDLERAVLQQDPALAVDSWAHARATCPWPGLASYDVQDAETFFGREAELTECLRRVARTPLLAVVGPSGSGKSSLVRAGLAARLRDERRTVCVVTPGSRPLDALGAELARLRPGGVLVVDQFEEVLAPGVPESVRAAFLDQVVARTTSGPVVLTLGADRLGELTAYHQAARLVEEGMYLLGGMDEAALRQTIEGPAHRAGLLLEPGLVDLLVRDVEGEPGSLPLLAHALRQTWERREGSTLTVEGYRRSGRIRGAIAQSAEHVYESAAPAQRHALRELLLSMVQPGPDGEPIRTSVTRQAVTSGAESAELIEQLVRARLVTAQADRLEIAHEALVRAWPRLQSWLADDVQGERIRHHLTAAAGAWETMGRPDSELYRGARLAAAREWRDSGSHQLSRVDRDFLEASEAAHRSTLGRAQEEARRQRRANRRLRFLAAAAAVLALLAASFGGVARWQWSDARSSEAVARSAEALARTEADRARSHELAASAVAAVDEDPALAKSLAVLAADVAPPTFQSRDALHRVIAADQVVSRLTMFRRPSELTWAQLHPDGGRVAMAAEAGLYPGLAIEVHDALSGEVLWEWVRPDEPGYESAFVAGAEYSPDGELLAGGVLWHPQASLRLGPPTETAPPPAEGVLGVHVWDARSHESLGVVDVGPCGGWPLAIAGDHLLVRTLVPQPGSDAAEKAAVVEECRWFDGAMGTVAVNRITGESHLLTVVTALNLYLNVGHALSHDGTLAVVPDFAAGQGVLADTTSGREIGRLPAATGFDFDAAGERLLARDRSNAAVTRWTVLSVPDLSTLTRFTGHETQSFYARFGPGDTTVFSTGLDNRLFQWDATTGELIRRLDSVGAGVPTSAGDLVLASRLDSSSAAVLVRTTPAGELWSAPPCQGSPDTDRLRVAGELVVVARDCDAAARGRLETFTLAGEPVAGRDDVSWEAFEVSPDGTQVVARAGAGTSADGLPLVGELRVSDLETGEVRATLEGLCTHQIADSYLGIPEDDPALGRCGRLGDRTFTFTASSLRWSPDGRFIAAVDGSLDGVGVWDAGTGRNLAAIGTPADADERSWAGVYDARFSPGSDRLVLSTMSGHLLEVDTGTWDVLASRLLGMGDSAAPVGYAADGSLVVVNPLRQNAANASILLLDPEDLTQRRVWPEVAEGAVQSAALSPDATRVALATGEGVLTVWDLDTGTLVERADPRLGSLHAVQWMDDTSLVVLSSTGQLTTVTTDDERLLALARSTLTRGLSEGECATFELSPCPSLNALRGSPPVVPEDLRGVYQLEWSADELLAAATSYATDAFGELDEASLSTLSDQSEILAGIYRLDLGESDYTISRGSAGEVWCTGTVSSFPSHPDRLLLGADGGSRCSDFHYVELGWELDGDQLVLPRQEFRGAYADTLLWTAKPLHRVG